MTSRWGLGVVKWDGQQLVFHTVWQNGTGGSWKLDTSCNRVQLTGDLDGDGRAEALITGPDGIAILKLIAGKLTCLAQASNGAKVGEWKVDSRHQSMGRVGDVNGDGKDEIIMTSASGTGVLALKAGALTSQLVIDNGSNLGSWRLNTDGNDWASGSAKSWCLVIGHEDWKGAAQKTKDALRRRGYLILETDLADRGRELIGWLARTVRQGDRVFIYLAGHGGAGRPLDDYTVQKAGSNSGIGAPCGQARSGQDLSCSQTGEPSCASLTAAAMVASQSWPPGDSDTSPCRRPRYMLPAWPTSCVRVVSWRRTANQTTMACGGENRTS